MKTDVPRATKRHATRSFTSKTKRGGMHGASSSKAKNTNGSKRNKGQKDALYNPKTSSKGRSNGSKTAKKPNVSEVHRTNEEITTQTVSTSFDVQIDFLNRLHLKEEYKKMEEVKEDVVDKLNEISKQFLMCEMYGFRD